MARLIPVQTVGKTTATKMLRSEHGEVGENLRQYCSMGADCGLRGTFESGGA